MTSSLALLLVAVALEVKVTVTRRAVSADAPRPLTLSTTSCPKSCFCNLPSGVVNCARKGLPAIPLDNIPPNSLEIILNGNQFLVPFLRRSNFSASYAGVERLFLSDCGLESILPDTFRDLTALKWLDLNSNHIRVIQPHTFAGLSLQHLFLNGNRQLRLSYESFGGGLRVAGLFLHDCSLTSLHPEVLQPLNTSLRNLWLNDNALERLHSRHLPLFSSLTHLRLAANPFHCNCETAWLKQLLDVRKDLVYGSPLPTCSSPLALRGSGFESLTTLDFSCLAPTFNTVETQFDHRHGRLRCVATGDPLPTLYWVRPTGETRRYTPFVTLTEPVEVTNEAVLSIEHVKEPDSLTGVYMCIAVNDGGNVTLTLNVSWPPISGSAGFSYRVSNNPINPYSTLGSRSTSQRNPLLLPAQSRDSGESYDVSMTSGLPYNDSELVVLADNNADDVIMVGQGNHSNQNDSNNNWLQRQRHNEIDYFIERRYTLTELIVAVVCIHVATVLLVLALIACYQRRQCCAYYSPPVSSSFSASSSSSAFRYSRAASTDKVKDKKPSAGRLGNAVSRSRFHGDYPTSHIGVEVYPVTR
jgi:hypothetical protein